MHPIIRNTLAIVAGWVAGSSVNMFLVNLGHSVFPIEGVDKNDMQALAEVMPELDPVHFIFPFLAHALGTFVGALIAALIAANRKVMFALIIGTLFLLGGIAVNYLLPGPLWFTVADLALAYIPTAWLAGRLINDRISTEEPTN